MKDWIRKYWIGTLVTLGVGVLGFFAQDAYRTLKALGQVHHETNLHMTAHANLDSLDKKLDDALAKLDEKPNRDALENLATKEAVEAIGADIRDDVKPAIAGLGARLFVLEDRVHSLAMAAVSDDAGERGEPLP